MNSILIANQDEKESFDSILLQQRDRLKQALVQLEAEKAELTLSLDSQTSVIQQLTTDNINLTEKVRYLSSQFGAKEGVSSAETRYVKIVDETNNPFQKFQQGVSKMHMNQLSSADRLTLSASSYVLGTKNLRMFLLFYALSLHLLVFFSFYYHTLHKHC